MKKMAIGFIGAGKMGTALLEGFLKKSLVQKSQILVSDTDKNRINYFKSLGIKSALPDDLARESDIIFLAVKPIHMQEVCDAISPNINKNTIIIVFSY